METSIEKKATWGYLLKFALPTIVSMVVMGTFGIIDMVFVSRLIDPIALAPVGVVFPFFSFVAAVGFMLGVGGNALVAKKIGEGKEAEARVNFSLIITAAFVLSVVIGSVGLAAPELILNILGARGDVRTGALEYMMPLLYFMPAIILGMAFNQFLVTEGKAYIVTIVTVISGLTSAGLNYVFIYLMDMGLGGAALATSIAYTLPALTGLTYFTFKRSGKLYLVKPKFQIRVLGRASINGASEMVTMLTTSVTATFVNNILARIDTTDGGGAEAQAAAAIVFSALGVFSAVFIGYSAGVMPIISYNFGKGDAENLSRVYKNSLRLLGVIAIFSVTMGWLLTNFVISVFDVPMWCPFHAMFGIYDVRFPIHEMSAMGIRIVTAGFIFFAFNAFSSMMFTALNNGVVSSILSLGQWGFVIVFLLFLPDRFGVNGVWLSMPFADLLGISLTIFFFKKMKKRYKYA